MKRLTNRQKHVLEELLSTLLFTLGAAAIALFYLYGQPVSPAHPLHSRSQTEFR